MAHWLMARYNNELERLLDEVYAELQPSSSDRNARERIIQYLNTWVARDIQGCSSFTAFGSYKMEMFTSDSDLDLSLEVNHESTKASRVFYLKRFANVIRRLKAMFDTVQPVYMATVPVVKFRHCSPSISCDVSVDNSDGVFKSTFLGALATIDPRFRQLCFLLKQWSKAHGLNDSSAGGLSSYCLILLATVHLQMSGILPPLSCLMPSLEGDFRTRMLHVETVANQYRQYGASNTLSVAEVFKGFFVTMGSVRDSWKRGLCASAFEGCFISRPWSNLILVEDFVNRSQNAGRTLSSRGFDVLYMCIGHTQAQLTNPTSNLKQQLFGLNETPVATAPTPAPAAAAPYTYQQASRAYYHHPQQHGYYPRQWQ